MKVRMKVSLGGSWPAVGEVTQVEPWRGERLIANGWAESVDDAETTDGHHPVVDEVGEVDDG